MRYKCVVTYDGSGFHGFQYQENLRTVQGDLEKAISSVTNTKVRIYGAGRTDVGVHGIGQVFHLQTYLVLKETTIMRAINDRLPPDIRIKKVTKVSESFHARYSAILKTYDYYIDTGEYSPLFEKYRYYCPDELNIYRMLEASKMFLGKHDFRTFTKNQNIANTLRTMHSIEFFTKKTLIRIRFRADGFMHNMIRILLASLIDVGRGEMTIEELKDRFGQKNRRLATKMVPSSGLYFLKVDYLEESEIDDEYVEDYDDYDEFDEYNEHYDDYDPF